MLQFAIRKHYNRGLNCFPLFLPTPLRFEHQKTPRKSPGTAHLFSHKGAYIPFRAEQHRINDGVCTSTQTRHQNHLPHDIVSTALNRLQPSDSLENLCTTRLALGHSQSIIQSLLPLRDHRSGALKKSVSQSPFSLLRRNETDWASEFPTPILSITRY